MPALPLGPTSARGASCARTLRAALEDIQLRPEVLHIVGAGPNELSLDFRLLARSLSPGARVVFIGPHALMSGAREELLGPQDVCGLQVSVFPQTYQRYTTQFPLAEAPNFVAMFHPGLDIHFFSWYPCLKKWAESAIPVLVTAYKMPDGIGERPETVQRLLEVLVGTGNGVGMWVMEQENEHAADDGIFNAAYYVFLGSEGALSPLPDDIYVHIYSALKDLGHPFAPRVGYLDVDDMGALGAAAPRAELAASIAEGAVRGAKASEDCTDELAELFACTVLDEVLGAKTGEAWRRSRHERASCANCGEGYDSAPWHAAICPAVGRAPLAVGDRVVVAKMPRPELDGHRGVLQRFDRQKQRWRVRMESGKDCLWSAANLELDRPAAPEPAQPATAATAEATAGEAEEPIAAAAEAAAPAPPAAPPAELAAPATEQRVPVAEGVVPADEAVGEAAEVAEAVEKAAEAMETTEEPSVRSLREILAAKDPALAEDKALMDRLLAWKRE